MVTLEDVAKKAHVSAMTVSRILNNPDCVKPETRERVNKIIKDMNYRPNMIAKSLVKGSSRTIGVIYSNIYNQAYLDIIMGINAVAYSKDYCIMSSNVDNYKSAVKALEMLLANQIDGIIILPMEMSMSVREDYNKSIEEMGKFYHYLEKLFKKLNIPAITISQKCLGINNISFDYKKLAEIAIEYLISLGKTDIAMINSIIKEGLWFEKENVYKEIMKSRGLEKYINIEREPATVQGGHIAMDRISKWKRVPQAVFCANDYIAIGAIQSAWSNGLNVPGDISIIGNDDVQFCKMTFPKLTTVSLNAFNSGEKAMNILLEKIAGREVSDIVIEHNIVIRDSVA